jgi:hypothetical protein
MLRTAEELSKALCCQGFKIGCFYRFKYRYEQDWYYSRQEPCCCLRRIELLPAINVIGLHAYDGHIREQDVLLRKDQGGG